MPIWMGETWTCARCEFVNAVLRRRCRNCGERREDGCPKCGGQLTFGYGLAGGGIGSYWMCLDCDFFEKKQDTESCLDLAERDDGS